MVSNCLTHPVVSVESEIFCNLIRWRQSGPAVSVWYAGFFVGFLAEIGVDNYNAMRYS
jgi:predicted hydrocarbon binding protein